MGKLYSPGMVIQENGCWICICHGFQYQNCVMTWTWVIWGASILGNLHIQCIHPLVISSINFDVSAHFVWGFPSGPLQINWIIEFTYPIIKCTLIIMVAFGGFLKRSPSHCGFQVTVGFNTVHHDGQKAALAFANPWRPCRLEIVLPWISAKIS